MNLVFKRNSPICRLHLGNFAAKYGVSFRHNLDENL